jgi:hypothetical protein
MTDENALSRTGQPRGGSRTSQQGAEDKDQNLDTERIVVDAPATGDARVDDAVAGLSQLPARPAEEHVAILEEVHGRLRDILDDLGPEHDPAGGSARGVRGDGVSPKGGLGGWVPPEEGAGTVVPPGQP